MKNKCKTLINTKYSDHGDTDSMLNVTNFSD